jgi:hypothetical protein
MHSLPANAFRECDSLINPLCGRNIEQHRIPGLQVFPQRVNRSRLGLVVPGPEFAQQASHSAGHPNTLISLITSVAGQE